MKKIGLLFTLAILVAFSSCKFVGNLNVEKRHYSKGFYVHVRDENNKVNSPVETAPSILPSANVPVEVVAVSSPVIPVAVSTPSNVIASSSVTTTVAALPVSQKEASSIKPTQSTTNNSVSKKNNPVEPFQKKQKPTASDVDPIILILLAIFLSPIAVFLMEGASKRFWIDLICWLLGAGVVGFFYYGGALLLFAIIYALFIVLGVI